MCSIPLLPSSEISQSPLMVLSLLSTLQPFPLFVPFSLIPTRPHISPLDNLPPSHPSSPPAPALRHHPPPGGMARYLGPSAAIDGVDGLTLNRCLHFINNFLT